MMYEREMTVLSRYELNITKISRTRGAFLCEAESGECFLLRECTVSAGRLFREAACLEALERQGVAVDRPLANTDGEMITQGEDGRDYYVRSWQIGREINAESREDIGEALMLLGRLHVAMQASEEAEKLLMESVRQQPEDGQKHSQSPMPVLADLQRHNRELRRAASYIRRKRQKSDKERLILQGIRQYLPEAESALQALEAMKPLPLQLCHGSYTHHKVIRRPGGCRIVDFSNIRIDVPLEDLCLIVRKLMEKWQWRDDIGRYLLESYETVRPLGREERRYLAFRLRYPEKFWKQVNFYFNGGRMPLGGNSSYKLERLMELHGAKERFIDRLEARC